MTVTVPEIIPAIAPHFVVLFHHNERIINAGNRFNSSDDDLPDRFFTDSGTSGAGVDIRPLDRDEFLKTRSDYYRIRGLDSNGIPIEDKAGELGLSWKS